jgi:light-regulated signal transduction histidine kinase (bacteriophytochrome)
MSEMSDKEKLQKLEKEFEEFLYIISHDFAAPLRHINGFVSIIQQDKQNQLDAQTTSCLNNISKSSKHLDAMLKGLLKLSRVNTRPGERTTTSLSGIIEAAWYHDLRHFIPEDAQLNVAEMPVYFCDESQLQQTFGALLLNCIEYRNPTGGLKINVTHNFDGDMHVICIEDNGIGIHPKMTERVLKPFARAVSAADFPGLGMGLAFAKKVIKHHNGTIEINVSENASTCVIIHLPKVSDDEKLVSTALST